MAARGFFYRSEVGAPEFGIPNVRPEGLVSMEKSRAAVPQKSDGRGRKIPHSALERTWHPTPETFYEKWQILIRTSLR